MTRPAGGLPTLVHRRQLPRRLGQGKKINGRKRHIAVGTLGLLLCVQVTTACVPDRDAARPLLDALTASCRWIRLAWADGG